MDTQVVRRCYFSAAIKNHREEYSGHNFILEAYVSGPVQPDTGMILSIKSLDEVLFRTTQKLDHTLLNTKSSELLAQQCLDEVRESLSPLKSLILRKIRLYETEDFWVDCGPNIKAEI